MAPADAGQRSLSADVSAADPIYDAKRSRSPEVSVPPLPWWRRLGRAIAAAAIGLFRYGSLVVLLAFLVAVPALQLIVFGYLLEASGRLARGNRLRDAVPWNAYATRIGYALVAMLLVSLPVHLLTHWSQSARLVDPHGRQAEMLQTGSFFAAVAAMVYLGWAWIRGGKLRHYLWPAPVQFLKQIWRPRTWIGARDALWGLARELEIPQLFWLGLRGVVGTVIWILPPAGLFIFATREGQGGAAGLVGAFAFVTMALVLLYLPMLQAHFAAENRLRAMFAVRTVRRDFRRAPWCWMLALLVLYGLAIPLYLLKIEPVPQPVVWLPSLLFVAFMLPARIAVGLAIRRGRSKADPRGVWSAMNRWTVRLLIPVIVGIYIVFLFASQFVDANGMQTWIQQHAVMVPVPQSS